MNLILKIIVSSLFILLTVSMFFVKKLSFLIGVSIISGLLMVVMILISETLESISGAPSPMSPTRSSRRDNTSQIIIGTLVTIFNLSLLFLYRRWNEVIAEKMSPNIQAEPLGHESEKEEAEKIAVGKKEEELFEESINVTTPPTDDSKIEQTDINSEKIETEPLKEQTTESQPQATRDPQKDKQSMVTRKKSPKKANNKKRKTAKKRKGAKQVIPH